MSLITPNTDSINNHYDKGRYLMVWRISLLFILVFGALTAIFIYTEEDSSFPVFVTFAISLVSFIYLNITKKFIIFFWVYAITGTIVANLALNFIFGPSHFVDFIWLLVSVLIAFIGISANVGLIFLIINVLGMMYFMFFSLNSHIEDQVTLSFTRQIAETVEIMFSIFVFGYIMVQFIEFQTHAKKQVRIINADLQVKINENRILVKEVHHRVKNNLQIIVSLLRLQKEEDRKKGKDSFDESINRVRTMALIHEKLYQQNNLKEIIIEDYINEFISEVKALYDMNEKLTVNFKSSVGSMKLKNMVPFCLLLNELFTNSIKHAFNETGKGTISISIDRESDAVISLIYGDSGKWNNSSETSFGTELIESLTEQMDGKYQREGSQYSFQISDLDE